MSCQPNLPVLSEPERTLHLEQFLKLLNEHPSLAPFRAAVPAGSDRQLAFFAALERDVLLGSPVVHPPQADDLCDTLLCDILEAIDTNPELRHHGSFYGPHRHLANLQAFGAWRGNAPRQQQSAGQLFATRFSRVSSEQESTCPAHEAHLSPLPQDSARGGELIATFFGPPPAALTALSVSQSALATGLANAPATQLNLTSAVEHHGIVRHQASAGGEQCAEAALSSDAIPPRAIRKGRPPALDDLAKGRLLGLMSYGLSFRQAAAQVGVHHQTILNLMKRDESFAQQVSEARLDAISQPLLTVVQASRKNWRAAAWLAKFLEDRRTRPIETTPEERAAEDRRSA